MYYKVLVMILFNISILNQSVKKMIISLKCVSVWCKFTLQRKIKGTHWQDTVLLWSHSASSKWILNPVNYALYCYFTTVLWLWVWHLSWKLKIFVVLDLIWYQYQIWYSCTNALKNKKINHLYYWDKCHNIRIFKNANTILKY